MATTLGDLVTRVRYQLRSFTGQHERTTYLTSGIGASDLTIPVADGQAASAGLIEIEDELLWILSSGGTNAMAAPFGRGYQGSTAASHAANTQVIADPFFPRQAVTNAINETAAAVYPELWAVRTYEFMFLGPQTTYGMPADCDRVLRVTWDLPGPTGEWAKVASWRLDQDANTTDYPNGKSLTLGGGIMPGRTVRVVYAGAFSTLSTSATTLASAGFAESHADVLTFGAAWRLIQFAEVQRLSLNDTLLDERGRYQSEGAASQLAARLIQIYQQRVAEERSKLLALHKPVIHRTR